MESTPNTPKQRPPYLLGLLGIIPMIGAFVGVGLILAGIFRYKDRKLIIIGAAGILWTIVVYGALFSFMNSKTFSSGFEPISRSDLNELVADIELYNLQHGRYPDSLSQLREISVFARTFDPTQTSLSHGTLQYNYVKMGDRYRLFSSGPDGVPGTKDDVYPNLYIPDSSKIGLIRPNSR